MRAGVIRNACAQFRQDMGTKNHIKENDMATTAEMIKIIRDEYETETGVRPSASEAAVILDERLAAFVESQSALGIDEAIAKHGTEIAWTLGACHRKGTERRELFLAVYRARGEEPPARFHVVKDEPAKAATTDEFNTGPADPKVTAAKEVFDAKVAANAKPRRQRGRKTA
jgi:hypothetical protein